MNIRQFNNGPLPDFLEARAYFSAHEFALPKNDALEYIKWCHKQGHEVLGWDAWWPTTLGPTPLPDSCEGDAEHSDLALLNASFVRKQGMDVVINVWVEQNTTKSG